MKNKTIGLLIALAFCLAGVHVKAAANIKNPEKVIFSVNNKKYNNEAVYDSIYSSKGLQSMLNKLDYKYFSQKYRDDSRFAAKKAAKIKEIKADRDRASNFKLYNARNMTEYLSRSNALTDVYRELASLDGAYEKIYRKSDINYLYQNKISGTAKISHILITANPSGENGDTAKALNEAKNKALEIIEKINQGQSFSAAMRANNHGNNKAGYLGEYNIEKATDAHLDSNMVREAFKLEDKKVSQPIETSHGFEIVYMDYTKPKPTLEEARNTISQKLWNIYSSQNPNFSAYALLQGREVAGLKINDEAMKGQYANLSLKTKADYVQYDPDALDLE